MTAPARSVGPLLEIKGLKTHFFTQDGTVKAVDGVSFEIGHGQTLGVVGESGCGKSITSLSVMRLIERPGRIVAGEIFLNGDDMLKASDEEVRDIRGDQVSMIFQEPMTSLNPVFTCGEQISEAVQQHTSASSREGMDRAIEMLSVVGIPDAKRRAHEYPHQLSGGMRQRVMIAMALSTDPDLLIADEPTTALDVTIQAQILEVMRDLRERNRMAIMLITHDLGVVAEMADEVVVMYAGKVVERGDVRTIFGNPHHPYTKGLLSSIPRLDERVDRLEVIKGTVPSPYNLPSGCLFKRRCPYRMPVCDVAPPFQHIGDGHTSRCWLTPAGEAPDVGADASGEEAVSASAQLTTEPVEQTFTTQTEPAEVVQ
ncbi:MAG TPA: ABC transporter ATP-binding protein [Candidatus Limnocylindria bacterium]|nr:ABC transporter ATP-binding protein [Candidatus Limnocylindria bacterium]